MLTTRTDFAIATVPNAAGQPVVYTMGGRNLQGNPIRTVTAYNVATNTWTFRRGGPAVAWTNGAAVINGKIYLSGGFSDRNAWTSLSGSLDMYDPATNTWTRKRDMPSLVDPYGDKVYVGASGVSGVINGQLYVITACYTLMEVGGFGYYQEGGCKAPDYAGPAFFRYNPVTDRWTTLPSPFRGVVYSPFVGGVIGGKFYVLGGPMYGEEAAHTAYMAAYDPATNRWTTKNALGQDRPGAAAAVLGGKLYLFGGNRYNAKLDRYETLDKTLRYDPTTNLWTTRAPMPSARSGIAASPVTVNGQVRIEVIGGPAPGNNLQYVP
jgi:N-acetylneuraminic acid mutarotase